MEKITNEKYIVFCILFDIKSKFLRILAFINKYFFKDHEYENK
jgi:hypothetical protein